MIALTVEEVLEMIRVDPVLASLVEGLPWEACVCAVCDGGGCEVCGWCGVPLEQAA